MSQHDFNIANQTFPSFRADLNDALQAAATISAGASAPTTPYAYQLWYDTANEKYMIRNAANSAWLNFVGIDTNGNVDVTGAITTNGLTSEAANGTITSKASGSSFCSFTANTSAGNNAYVFFQQAGTEMSRITAYNGDSLAFSTGSGAAERLRITSAGKVGIGQTNPDSESLLDLGSGENSGYTRKLLVTNTGNSRAGLGALSNIFRVFYADDQAVQFGTLSRDGNFTFSEKMRISSSGVLSVGGTNATAKLNIVGQGGSNVQVQNNIATGTGGVVQIGFINDNGLVGSIQTSGTSTSYITSSDYRLKENVTDITDATTRLKQLNPVRFNFITDPDTTVDGFLAHEVEGIVPEAITGTKDAMRDEEYEVTPAVLDEDGNEVTPAVMGTRSVPDYQGIDQSKLVPLLVKTIQELEARITALEAS